jgi:hypothetical protein
MPATLPGKKKGGHFFKKWASQNPLQFIIRCALFPTYRIYAGRVIFLDRFSYTGLHS